MELSQKSTDELFTRIMEIAFQRHPELIEDPEINDIMHELAFRSVTRDIEEGSDGAETAPGDSPPGAP